MNTHAKQIIDTLQTLAHHGETTATNIEFHPKQLQDILSVIVEQNRRIMDLEDDLQTHPLGIIYEIIEDFQNTNPSFKAYENTYLDGWTDACNEILWALKERKFEAQS